MFPQFDPSKMDPKLMMELSQLIQKLPPHQLNQMQSIMHNMMAGFDVTKEMEEFEKSLPPEFREKIASLMSGQIKAHAQEPAASFASEPSSGDMNFRQARI